MGMFFSDIVGRHSVDQLRVDCIVESVNLMN